MAESIQAVPRRSEAEAARQLWWLWRQGQRPDLRQFITQSDKLTPAQLVAVLRVDQRERWQTGECILAEAYLAGYPAVGADPESAVDLVYGEFLLREEMGERPALDEYTARFPRYAAQLRLQVELHRAMESGSPIGAECATPLPQESTPPMANPPAPRPPVAAAWPVVPGYETVAQLARGGMSVVYKARQVGLQRLVALKMMPAAAPVDAEQLARFRSEAEAVARLEHPNIVQIHEVGELDGCPYFSLEYVGGGSLADKFAATPVPARQAALLVEPLAQAVHYAHQQGVIHRDLKPANVLLTADGMPKITDFGLAKQLDGDLGQTRSGALLGTPPYMAPEQAEGKTRQIGPATDVYGLGAILYELLTGRPPFRGATALETVEQVRFTEPVSPGRLVPKLPRDLETICLKCLRKEPHQRYPSAGALADDLRRFVTGQPIQARPIRGWERAVKWARRRPAIAGLLASVILVTALGFAGVVWQWREAEAARREDAAKAREIAKNAETLETNLYYKLIGLAEREQKRRIGSRADELLDQCPAHLRGWEWHYLKRFPFANFPALSHDTFVSRVAFSPDGLHLASGEVNGNVTLWDARTGNRLRTRRAHVWDVRALAFSPDGRRLATGGRGDRLARVWHVSTGELVYNLPSDAKGVEGLAFSPDGKLLGSASLDRTVRLWDVGPGRAGGVNPLILAYREHAQPLAPNGLAFSADGQRLTSVSVDGVVKVWEAATGETVSTFHGDIVWVASAAFSRDGRWLALGGENGAVKVYQTDPWKEVRTLEAHASVVRYLALSPDGRRLASAGEDRTLKVWDVTTGHEALLLDIHSAKTSSLAFSPDGHRLASGSADHTVKVSDGTPWVDLETGERGVLTPRFTWAAHDHKVVDVAFSPDSKRLISASCDKTVKVWGLNSGERGVSVPPLILTVPGLPADLTGVAFSRDGQRFAASSMNGTMTICDAHRGEKICTLQGKAGPVYGVAFHPITNALASAHYDGTVKVWDIERGRAGEANALILTIPAHKDHVLAVAYSAHGRLLASAGGRDQATNVGVWEAATGKPICRLHQEAFVRSVAFSPDGRRLACAHAMRVSLVDVESGRELLRTPSGDRVFRVVFSPDGRRLATACEGQTVQVFDAVSGKELDRLRVSGGELWGVAFSPDGRYLATCSGYKGKGTIQIWKATSWNNKP
jgi:WD40 repeat protein